MMRSGGSSRRSGCPITLPSAKLNCSNWLSACVAERRPSSLMASNDPSRALIHRGSAETPITGREARSNRIRVPNDICTGPSLPVCTGVVDNQVDRMIEDLIRRARRRFLLNETLAQVAFAAAVSIGGFVLMLIFGTRYLEWWTLAIFAAAGVAVGSWRVVKRTPTAYTTAVRLDQNARLHDALSTALHFSGNGNGVTG